MPSTSPIQLAGPTLHQTPQGLDQEVSACGLRLLSHRMSAGLPSPAADYSEEALDLNTYLVRNKPATFMFSVKGDSMIGASIEDGDNVVVHRALNPKHRLQTHRHSAPALPIPQRVLQWLRQRPLRTDCPGSVRPEVQLPARTLHIASRCARAGAVKLHPELTL